MRKYIRERKYDSSDEDEDRDNVPGIVRQVGGDDNKVSVEIRQVVGARDPGEIDRVLNGREREEAKVRDRVGDGEVPSDDEKDDLGEGIWMVVQRRRRVGLQWIVMWLSGNNNPSVHVLRTLIDARLGRRARYITSVIGRRQRANGRVRFDISVREGKAEKVMRRLCRKFDCQVRLHISYRERQRRRLMNGRPGVLQGRGRGNDIRIKKMHVMTWNVHGIAGKKPEIESSLQQLKIPIVALQETGRKGHSWRLTMSGYQVFERPALVGKGARGVAVLVDKEYTASLGPMESDFFVSARVYPPGADKAWTVISVYVPPRGPRSRRDECLGELKSQLRKALEDAPGPMVLMGDFNMDTREVNKWLNRHHLPFSVVAMHGSDKSFHGYRSDINGRGGQWSALDHILVTSVDSWFVSQATVDRGWDVSDHWPVKACIDVPRHRNAIDVRDPAAAGQRAKFTRELLNENKDAFLGHNRFAVLAEQITKVNHGGIGVDGDEMDRLAEEVIETCVEVGLEVGAAQVAEDRARAGKSKSDFRLSSRARRAIARRRNLFQLVVVNGRRDRISEFNAARKEALGLIRLEKKQAWVRHVSSMTEMVSYNDWKGAWRWVKRLVGNSITLHRIPPVYDPDLPLASPNRLVTEPARIADVWATFFRKLVADRDMVDGSSMEDERRRWKARVPLVKKPRYEGINEDLSWAEVSLALSKMRSGRAPGPDGLPPEVLKIAAESKEDRGDEPATCWGKVLFSTLQLLWRTGRIPKVWASAHVVPIPKKGDLCDMDNYRGISLIATVIKLLCVVLTDRLMEGAERRGDLRREQAGFRRGEECVGQACALYEIIRRRIIKGKGVYACFVDFRKAYDTVPHGALFHRLHSLGIRGRALRFIQGLYSVSSMQVRLPGRVGPKVRVQRGVRQGCPMSPLLFDLYIDSILDECEGLGIDVAGTNISGLLFADDVVCMATSRAGLQDILARVSWWADTWGMRVGANKCGVIAFAEGDLLDTVSRRVRRRVWRLQGDVINVVDSYTYLGLEFTTTLDLDVMAKARLKKGEKALGALRPLLSSHTIPVPIRVRIATAMLRPVLTYGGELYGMQVARAIPLQRVMNKALRFILGFGEKSKMVAGEALWAELGVAPVSAVINALRARAWAKYSGSKTIIAELCNSLPAGRKATWVTGTIRWLKRWGADLAHVDADLIQEQVWKWREGKSMTKSMQYYKSAALDKSVGFHQCSLKNLNWVRPLELVSRARMGGMLLAKRAVGMGIIHPRYKQVCPFCIGGGEETLFHVFNDCPAWMEARHRHLRDVLTEVEGFGLARQMVRVEERKEFLVGILLGGELRGYTLGPAWAKCEAARDAKPWCCFVGMFLLTIENARKAVFDRLAREFKQDNIQNLQLGVAGVAAEQDGKVRDNDDIAGHASDAEEEDSDNDAVVPPRGNALRGRPGLIRAHAPVGGLDRGG